MSLTRPPSSTVMAMSSRNPPSKTIACCLGTGPTPAARSSWVPDSVWIMVTNASIMSRCRRLASVPRVGMSRIQLSTTAGSDSAQAIHAVIACLI
jgi:hypothetical protein